MGTPKAEDHLKLEVRDFGPIVEAKIDLRPLTVFIGPSNTGKSYLAILIYALHRYFSGGGFDDRYHFSRRFPTFRGTGSEKLPEALVADLIALSKRLIASEQKSASDKRAALPRSVIDAISSGFTDQGGYLGNELGRCFGIEDLSSLVRKGTANTANVCFRIHRAGADAHVDHKLVLGGRDSQLSTTIHDDARLQLEATNDDYITKLLHSFAMEMMSQYDREPGRSIFSAWQLLE